jgi:FkbM family methyltransferase
MRLRVYPDSSSASLVLYCHGLPDYHEMRFMADYLRPGDGFIDVGANIGVYSLFAASLVGRGGRVVAFEPGPRAAARFRENVSVNGLGNIEVREEAVGRAAGSVAFMVDHDTMNRVAAMEGTSARSHIAPHRGAHTGTVVEVPCVRLDEALAGRSFAMGKMDIGGTEPLALCGAERMLTEANPPVWLLEMNGLLRDFGWTEEGLAAWLAGTGFELAVYDADERRLRFPRHHGGSGPMSSQLRRQPGRQCRPGYRSTSEGRTIAPQSGAPTGGSPADCLNRARVGCVLTGLIGSYRATQHRSLDGAQRSPGNRNPGYKEGTQGHCLPRWGGAASRSRCLSRRQC